MKRVFKFNLLDGNIFPEALGGDRFPCPYSQLLHDNSSEPRLHACGDWCPHFGDIEEKEDGLVVHLSCGSGNGGFYTKRWKE